MHGDAAMLPGVRARIVADAAFDKPANLMIMPNLDAANIAATLLASAADGPQIGPILVGTAAPINVLVPSVTARGIINLVALLAAKVDRPATGF